MAVPKYATRRGTRRRSWGEAIGTYATALGFPLMPWQQAFVDVAGEHRVRDSVPYRKTALCTVPRQSGQVDRHRSGRRLGSPLAGRTSTGLSPRRPGSPPPTG